MHSWDIFHEAIRIYKRHLRIEKTGFKRFDGDAMTICHTILNTLWNGQFLQTDLGNYPQFYARDFGISLSSLLQNGHHDRARATLIYALDKYREIGKITTHITPNGHPVSFPNVYSPDSVAYMLRSVSLLNDSDIYSEYGAFLQNEVNRFAKNTLGHDGRVLKNKHFGGMRDHVERNASCYETVMAAVLKNEALNLDLDYEYSTVDYVEILLTDYWTGSFFRDDTQNDTVSSDANIFPFWLGIIKDGELLRRTINTLQELKLDSPFPIKYVAHDDSPSNYVWQNIFVKNWQSDSIWPMSALPYIEILFDVDRDKALFHIGQFEALIEQHGTFLELYDRTGNPYTSNFLTAGEGMIWCAQWLSLKKRALQT